MTHDVKAPRHSRRICPLHIILHREPTLRFCTMCSRAALRTVLLILSMVSTAPFHPSSSRFLLPNLTVTNVSPADRTAATDLGPYPNDFALMSVVLSHFVKTRYGVTIYVETRLVKHIWCEAGLIEHHLRSRASPKEIASPDNLECSVLSLSM